MQSKVSNQNLSIIVWMDMIKGILNECLVGACLASYLAKA